MDTCGRLVFPVLDERKQMGWELWGDVNPQTLQSRCVIGGRSIQGSVAQDPSGLGPVQLRVGQDHHPQIKTLCPWEQCVTVSVGLTQRSFSMGFCVHLTMLYAHLCAHSKVAISAVVPCSDILDFSEFACRAPR